MRKMIKKRKRFTKHIINRKEFSVDVSDCGKFTVNISDVNKCTVNIMDGKKVTVNINDCKDYKINENGCGKEEKKITMRVLVACEESQRVCIEFRRLGHEVSLHRWLIGPIKILQSI